MSAVFATYYITIIAEIQGLNFTSFHSSNISTITGSNFMKWKFCFREKETDFTMTEKITVK